MEKKHLFDYNQSMNMKNTIIVSTSIIISAAILAFGLSNIIKKDRTVTVRGLSEREVDADLAIWPVSFSIGNNNLSVLTEAISHKTKIVTDFLKAQGLEESDYTILAPEIKDNSVNPYMSQNSIRYTFLATQKILVRTNKIENVKKAHEKTLSLADKDVTLDNEYDTRLTYEFTGLNKIKPEMIAEATQNARKSADQFARDSNSKVGNIKSATQGLFTIEDAAVGLEERKNIRVVTTVVYNLK